MNGRGDKKLPPWTQWLLPLTILLLFFFILPRYSPQQAYDIPYSRFKALIEEGRVAEVVLRGEAVEGVLLEKIVLGPQDQTGDRFSTRVPAFGDAGLLPALEAKNVMLQVERAEQGGAGGVLLAMLPWLIFLGLYFWLLRRSFHQLGGGLGGGEFKKFLDTTTQRGKIPDVRFDDVAGHANTKREVVELVEYLRHPEHYRRLGAEAPRGVLLMEPPGTGKTLLARALAGEAGVPFYSISASEFIEIFVGVGASRVRKLFEDAKKNAPSIIFIDELDSVGRTRGAGLGGGHDEREQTLNQILAEMDGFSGHEAVIVLAATNRPDVLDSALLRPGRFDRHVTLDLPDCRDREAILRVHIRKVPLAQDVVLARVAAATPGFSGADLKNLVNEAAMLAAREKAPAVTMRHFDEARDKTMLGTVRSLTIQPEEHHRLAVHESGHTLVAYYLPGADPVQKVSIIPRGRALGLTQQLPEQERYTLPEDYLRDRLAVLLAGRSAEQELLGSVSSGADDDIRQATTLARLMVTRWGMSREIGPVDLRESEEHPFLGREIAQPRHFSEASAQAVDEAVRALLLEAERRAIQLIRTRGVPLQRLIAALGARETLQRQEIESCLGGTDAVSDEPSEPGSQVAAAASG